MKIKVNSQIILTDITPGDKNSYVTHFKDKQICDQTLNIPFPYTIEDANDWLKHVAAQTKQMGRSVNWALRETNGHLIGGIGFHQIEEKNSHKAEIGYWLARAHWNQGIATDAVKIVCDFGFKKLRLSRITAHVFNFNIGSARVLIKNNFCLEGYLRKYYYKDGKFIDGLLFAKLADSDL